MRHISRWRVSVVHWLIFKNPCQFKGSLILDWSDLDHFLEHFLIKRMFCHLVGLVVFVGDGWELAFDNVSQLFDVFLAVDDHFHQVGWVMSAVEVKEHFSEVRVGETTFVACWKLGVRMGWLGQVLGNLVFSPGVVLEVFWVLGMYCVQLSFWWWVEHQGTDEELGESVKSCDESAAGYFKVEICLLLWCVCVWWSWVFGNVLRFHWKSTFM